MQPEAGVVSLAYAAAAFLAKVRAVVPAKFLKTADNIHCHKKLLSNTLLNNLCLHDMLSRGLEAADSTVGIYGSPPLFALDRIRNANGAVQLMQRTAAMNGLAQAFTRRASLRTKSGSSGAVSRLCNPLVAFSGAPGGAGEIGVNAVMHHAKTFLQCTSRRQDSGPRAGGRAHIRADVERRALPGSGDEGESQRLHRCHRHV